MAIEADLIEDIGRIHGYDRLPSLRPRAALRATPPSEARVSIGEWREILVQRGYQEAITYSFVDPRLQQRLDPGRPPVVLANPISSEMSVMRTTLWAGLLRAAQHNLNRQQARVRLFEYGLNYIIHDDELTQDSYIAGLACGSRLPEQWGVTATPLDFFDVKADVEALLAAGGVGEAFTFRADCHPSLHPGCTARIERGAETVGWLGTLHPELAAELDVPENTVVFELEAQRVAAGAIARFQEISRFPAIRRDLAFIVDAQVTANALSAVARAAAGPLLRDLAVFDLYQGPGVESGRKSIALGLILQDSSRTLAEQDVEAVLADVQTALNASFGANLRE